MSAGLGCHGNGVEEIFVREEPRRVEPLAVVCGQRLRGEHVWNLIVVHKADRLARSNVCGRRDGSILRDADRDIGGRRGDLSGEHLESAVGKEAGHHDEQYADDGSWRSRDAPSRSIGRSRWYADWDGCLVIRFLPMGMQSAH